ncbi:hypothetical protein BCR34DRAFT_605044 [Clohesyomyces aquaticus]|uniref:Zn(2)-C6 fungal-type domain-containing protein n=1 Tax=Clohesyomyces aquaticus TaxID=1231657 RepID=A0A1Y1Z0W8_9PLEO|nr:hypothetical protein BCR34DRAFT_605044 [Clohesyomyces aquaticus]
MSYHCFRLSGHSNISASGSYHRSQGMNDAGGFRQSSCLRCRFLKKKCSGGDPCDLCAGAANKSYSARALTWMECIRTNIRDLIDYQSSISPNPEITDELATGPLRRLSAAMDDGVTVSSSMLRTWIQEDESRGSMKGKLLQAIFSPGNLRKLRHSLGADHVAGLTSAFYMTVKLVSECGGHEVEILRNSSLSHVLSALDRLVQPSKLEQINSGRQGLEAVFSLLFATWIVIVIDAEANPGNFCRHVKARDEFLKQLLWHYLVYLGTKTQILSNDLDQTYWKKRSTLCQLELIDIFRDYCGYTRMRNQFTEATKEWAAFRAEVTNLDRDLQKLEQAMPGAANCHDMVVFRLLKKGTSAYAKWFFWHDITIPGDYNAVYETLKEDRAFAKDARNSLGKLQAHCTWKMVQLGLLEPTNRECGSTPDHVTGSRWHPNSNFDDPLSMQHWLNHTIAHGDPHQAGFRDMIDYWGQISSHSLGGATQVTAGEFGSDREEIQTLMQSGLSWAAPYTPTDEPAFSIDPRLSVKGFSPTHAWNTAQSEGNVPDHTNSRSFAFPEQQNFPNPSYTWTPNIQARYPSTFATAGDSRALAPNGPVPYSSAGACSRTIHSEYLGPGVPSFDNLNPQTNFTPFNHGLPNDTGFYGTSYLDPINASAHDPNHIGVETMGLNVSTLGFNPPLEPYIDCISETTMIELNEGDDFGTTTANMDASNDVSMYDADLYSMDYM